MKKAPHLTLGAAGEEAAVKHLKSLGYRIRHRNWRYNHQELDIIAESKDFTIIVEVKSRRQTDYEKECFGTPAVAISKEKRQRLRGAAALYRTVEQAKKPLRFDVIEVSFTPETDELVVESIHHMQDAF